MTHAHVLVSYIPGSGGQILGWILRQCIDSSAPELDPQDLAQGHCHRYKSYFGCRITESNAHRYGYWDRLQGTDYPVPPPQAQGSWPEWRSQFTPGRIRVLPSHRAFRPGDLPPTVRQVRIVVREEDLDLVFALYQLKMAASITREQWLAHMQRDLRLAVGRSVANHIFCLDRDLDILGVDPDCELLEFRSLLDPQHCDQLDQLITRWALSEPQLIRARASHRLWREINHRLLALHRADLWNQWLNITYDYSY